MNSLEEMISVSSSSTTSGSDDATLKKQRIPSELSVLTCINGYDMYFHDLIFLLQNKAATIMGL